MGAELVPGMGGGLLLPSNLFFFFFFNFTNLVQMPSVFHALCTCAGASRELSTVNSGGIFFFF